MQLLSKKDTVVTLKPAVFNICTTYRGKSIFEKLLNNKKVGLQGCQVASVWSEQGKLEC